MKLRIHNQQTGLTDTVEVIDEFEDLMTLRNKLNKLYSTNEDLRNKKLFLIFKNMVLSDDKILKFYKISDNDEISVRYLENLLQNDEHILEIFLAGLFPSIMYLIVEQDDRISTVKSIIRNIVQNISRIYDKNSNEISLENNVIDIDRNNGYYKLIISCDNTSVGGENQTIKTCCDLHDRYFIDLYLKKFPSIIRKIDYEDDWKTNLINKINTMREKINNVNVDKFNGILSIFDNQLVRSRFLFVTEMAEHINHYCDEFWNETFDVSSYPVRDHFFAVLHVCINEYLKSDKYNKRDQYIGRKIVIESLDKFINNIENDEFDWRYLMKLLLDDFLIGRYSTDDIQNIFNSKRVCPSFKIRQNQKTHLVDIPLNCHIISELKLAVSYQTNVNKEQLYFIKLNSVQKPKDSDQIDINDLNNCLMEIISGSENIEKIQKIGEGSFGKILLFKNTSTNRTFGMKKPVGRGDLYGEISNHCRIHNCDHIKTYIGLILYKNCVCIAMEFMQRGSLISYLEREGYRHEAEISKLSQNLLTQIDAIHKRELIHRDINGDNILFNDKGEAILIDFGISVHCSFLQDENFIRNLFKNLYGTWGYFAPELLNSEIFTNKVDIWSFGVVVIEMIYGERVQPIGGILGKDQRMLTETPKPLSDNLIKFCKSCTNMNPNERSSADELLKFKFIRHYKKSTMPCTE